MRKLILFTGVLLATTPSYGSFIANCAFETELVSADVLVRRLGGVLYQRSVNAKILKATNDGISHIDCAKTYLNKTITFPIQLLKDEDDKAAATLGGLKIGDMVKVKYEAMNGRAAWGGGIDAVDYWLIK